jgi:xylulokinase
MARSPRQQAREHRLSVPRPGWAEHDAEDWWRDFASITRELTAAAGEPVVGAAVSGIGPCVLPADSEGTPLRRAILYGIDTRAAAEITELTQRYDAAEVLRICGSPLTSQAAGPKLVWLRRHEPETWAGTAKVMTASSFLVHRLTGEYVLDHHTASQYTPMYDLPGRRGTTGRRRLRRACGYRGWPGHLRWWGRSGLRQRR